MEIRNYTLKEQRDIPEYQMTGYVFEHNQSGARIFYAYAPKDDNQVFSISFLTPPSNDCGIPHILEHSVLNGSEKYPVKEPFVELLKGSLNTFLNAITFPDKTMFPVASRNEKDFMNLAGVYLDAVFHPLSMKNRILFEQEGWHYDLGSPSDEITYNGVVYNEMKGAYSEPEEGLSVLVNKTLYPDTIYSRNSGGDPLEIPKLSYDEYREFYHHYYHPSNSYIYFYGNGDIKKHLEWLDEEYLSHYSRQEKVPDIPLQKPLTANRTAFGHYAVSEGENQVERTFLTYAMMLDPVEDVVEYNGLTMLDEMLVNVEASPLRLALLEAGIGQSVSMSVETSLQQPLLTITARNAETSQMEAFVRVIEETVAGIVKNGYDPKLVEATLNSEEFALRESDFGSVPKGLMLGIGCMDSWLYGRSPMEFLPYEEAIRTIRNDPRYFEKLTAKVFKPGRHHVTAVLEPEVDLNVRLEKQTRDYLAAYKRSLSQEQVQQLVDETKRIRAFQEEEDDPESLRTLPLLKREDLTQIKPLESAREVSLEGGTVSVYDGDTNHIVYADLEFDLNHVPEDKLCDARLLANVFGLFDTDKYSFTELDNEIGRKMGDMEVGNRCLARMDGGFNPSMIIRFKFLPSRTEQAFSLMKEMLLHSHYDMKERVREQINRRRIGMEEDLSAGGHSTALHRCFSYFSPLEAYQQKLTGLDYFDYLTDLSVHFDEKWPQIYQHLLEVSSMLFVRPRLRIRLTLTREDEGRVLNACEDLFESLPDKVSPLESSRIVRVKPAVRNEGLITPGKVQYVACAGHYHRPYMGDLLVMGNILELDYLWSRVRAQGGAYGCMKAISRMGYLGMVSYRDPNLEQTLDAYREAGRFMQQFDCDEREITKYIIGTMAQLDSAKTVSMKGKEAHDCLEALIPRGETVRLGREVVETTPEKIRRCSEVLEQAMSEPYLCVVGTEEKIRQNADKFMNIRTLKQEEA